MRAINMRSRYSIVFVLAVLSLVMLGCAPPPESDPQAVPELTKELIDERINDARVFEVLPESGTGEPISWSFDFDEPKEIAVIDQKITGDTATIILDIKTRSAPYAKTRRELAGQIRTDWRLETALVIRRWEIVNTENISMKYRDIPKAQANSNSNGNNNTGPQPADLPGPPKQNKN